MNRTMKLAASIAVLTITCLSLGQTRLLISKPGGGDQTGFRFKVLDVAPDATITSSINLHGGTLAPGMITPVIGNITTAAFDVAFIKDTSIRIKSFDANGFQVGSIFIGSGHNAERLIGFGDFNGNGDVELIYHRDLGAVSAIEIDPTTGNRTFFDLMVQGALGEYSRAVGVEDVDGDGDDDLVVTDPATGNIRYAYFNGTEALGLSTEVFAPEQTIGHEFFGTYVGAVDVDGDSSVDLVVEPKPTNESLKARVWFMNGLSSRRERAYIWDPTDYSYADWLTLNAGRVAPVNP